MLSAVVSRALEARHALHDHQAVAIARRVGELFGAEPA